MVLKIIEDIRKALENDLHFVALNSALTLPDICGKAAYPNEVSSKKRYVLWYDEEIGKYEKCPGDQRNMPYLSGEVVYSLRCSLLHEGNPNVNNDKLKEGCSIDKFSLVVEKNKTYNSYSDSSSIENYGGKCIRKYRMNVRRICEILCSVAESYYKENREKFSFNYEIIDWDEVTSHMPPIDMNKFFAELARNDKEIYQEKKVGGNE